MIDAKNIGTLTCGVVADPEIKGKNENIVRLRVAADYAGNDQNDPSNKTGYFTVTYFLEDDQNSRFVDSQIKAGNIKKGTQLQIVYRLLQSRYTNRDGANAQSVDLVAESMTYASSRPNSEGGSSTSPTPANTEVPSKF